MNTQALAVGSTCANPRWASVTDLPLDQTFLADWVTRPEAGAVVSFVGVVRSHDDGRTVLGLDYLAHPSSDAVLKTLTIEASGWPSVLAVAAAHRTGSLTIGDVAMIVTVSCAHRAEAFAACERLVEQVKTRLPMWKRQVFADGSYEWVGCA